MWILIQYPELKSVNSSCQFTGREITGQEDSKLVLVLNHAMLFEAQPCSHCLKRLQVSSLRILLLSIFHQAKKP